MMLVAVGGAAYKRTTPVEELAWEQMTPEEVATLASTLSLLGDTRTFLLVGALAGPERDAYLALAPGLIAAPHQIIFEEEKLLKRESDLLTKAGATLLVAPKAPARAGAFDVFSVANAFAARDRKQFWLLLSAAARADVVPEAVAGMLAWKVRDMLSKKAHGTFSRDELVQISRQLVALYHDSHRGAGDLSLLLERFALTL